MARRTVIASVLAVATASLASNGVAQERTTDALTLSLPAPTGPHRIGVTTLHLVDRARRDPWDAGRVREVMVSLFYPARTVRGHSIAPQMTAVAARWFTAFDTVHLRPELPESGVDWAATMTHAYTDAPAQPIPRPVLLYTPGGGDPRTMGTAIAEELASHGHVVVTVDHPGESGAVEFPDGSVREYALPGTPDYPQVFRTMIDTRIADVPFVLDQLTVLAAGQNPDAEGRRLPKGLGCALDLGRVGAYGHSAGGTTAAQALYEDDRMGAAVNLEGYLDHPSVGPGREGELFPVARHGVDRPLLLLGTDGYRNARFERSWSALLAHSRGHARRRELNDAAHWVFTDYAAIAPRLQIAGLMTADDRIKLVGPGDPAKSVRQVRHHVLSFFSRHLRMR
ncbi:alpha/beta hydrolase [Streptomyces sp. NPDC005953]|uniref:alpha/beta hydrolase family protein n=1 Tax=Streptomyces sp. NPDC005953 TaxID=3156719 RepID=UPI0033F2E5CA